VFILSATEQLTAKQRLEIETRLANYNIPVQILQMVAQRCQCTFDSSISGRDLPRKPKLSSLLARLNDRAVVLLEQIFLDCQDSFSNFRFAVFLSSMYSPTLHKFVMDEKITGESGLKYSFDVGIYGRNTEKLVAVGMQNNDETQKAANNKSLRQFLAAIKDLRTIHQSIQGAYYSSSYGYQDDNPWRLARKTHQYGETNWKVEIRFFDYRDKIYSEIKSS
jgi:hypothetical protein